MTPPQRGGFNAPLLAPPHIDIDRALEIAIAGSRCAAGDLPASAAAQLAHPVAQPDSEATVTVDDRSGTPTKVTPNPATELRNGSAGFMRAVIR